ncbi:porin family protein [uncultured Draconibacterium sp.]|uniref:porin family protein n=1 Tax=uncultured Draconibacterium sp. TaxID=1573823 RepID=UPI003217A15B
MKPTRIVPFLFVLFFTQMAYAQYPSVTFFGGANAASMAFRQGDAYTEIEDSYKTLFGMNIGVLYDYVLKKDRSQELSVESGIIFDSKGFNLDVQTDVLTLKNTTTMYYMDVPLYLKYIYRFRSLNKIYFGAGPYVGLGLFGNSNITFQSGSAEQSSNSEPVWGSDEAEDDFKRLDYGVTGKIGFLMDGGFNIALSYDYGLPNVAYLDEIEEYKHRVIRLSLGYTLKFED